MEVGGLPMLDEVEAQTLLQEVGSLFLPDTYIGVFLNFSFLPPIYILISALPLQGLGTLKRASTLKEEAHCLEEEAQWLELGNIEAAVAGLEAEGFYGLLRGAIAHPLTSSALSASMKACCAPSTTVSHPPSQESTGPEVSKPATGIAEQALEGCLPSCLASFRGSSPHPHASPSHSAGGIKECTDAGLKVAQRDHQPQSATNLHACAQSALGGGVGVSLLWQIILQLGHILMPQEESC